MDGELDLARRWLEFLERRHRATLSVIRDHPSITRVAEGNASLEDLRRFAVAEYWYMRGGVKPFALSILNAPDLETQRFFHERLAATVGARTPIGDAPGQVRRVPGTHPWAMPGSSLRRNT